MTKKYYADVFFYNCPKCRSQVDGKMYFGLFELAEMGAAKQAGVIPYRCTNAKCRAFYPYGRLLIQGEAFEVSREEALSFGLVFDSNADAA